MQSSASGTVKNVLTVMGAALLLYPIIDEAVKKLAPEMEKLSQSLPMHDIKQLVDSEHGKHSKESHEHKIHDDEEDSKFIKHDISDC